MSTIRTPHTNPQPDPRPPECTLLRGHHAALRACVCLGSCQQTRWRQGNGPVNCGFGSQQLLKKRPCCHSDISSEKCGEGKHDLYLKRGARNRVTGGSPITSKPQEQTNRRERNGERQRWLSVSSKRLVDSGSPAETSSRCYPPATRDSKQLTSISPRGNDQEPKKHANTQVQPLRRSSSQSLCKSVLMSWHANKTGWVCSGT